MTENKDQFPKIKPPSLIEILKAKFKHAYENPDIKKLMDEGKGVFVDTDTGNVRIIEDNDKKK